MALLGVCSVVAFLLVKQSDLLYQPSPGGISRRLKDNPPGMRSPEEYAIRHEVVSNLSTADGVRLSAWLLFAKASPKHAPTLIYMHGNAGNIGHRLQLFSKMHDHLEANILALEWRGFGDSEGKPSEPGLVQDALAALKWLSSHNKINPDRIFLFGTSLGGAVSIALASQPDVKIAGLICENSFTCVSDMGCVSFPFLLPFRPLLVPPILQNEWPSIRCVANVKVPLLFLCGSNDAIVPPQHSSELHDAAVSAKSKSLHVFHGGGHNDLYMSGNLYFSLIQDFLNKQSKDHAATLDNNASHEFVPRLQPTLFRFRDRENAADDLILNENNNDPDDDDVEVD